jgi:HEPN domain-containing protein
MIARFIRKLKYSQRATLRLVQIVSLDYLAMARYYLEEAYKLLSRGDSYDACEKVWASVKHATMALTLRILGEVSPPKGVSWRSFVEEAFTKSGLSEEEASKIASYFIDVRDRLHGGCFYGLIYEEGEHKPLIERAKEYVDLVEKILKRLTTSS